MKIPASTYRLQLSPEFTFNNLRHILDYLEGFQISTVYSAPFFQSRKGSTHGYDIIDPFKINKKIGDLENFREISDLLKQKGMDWLQDIVPNHMAYSPANSWIYSILEQGPHSEFYNFFDINWKYKGWEGKVMAPFLGDSLEKVITKGEIKLIFSDRGFFLQYFEHEYPASVNSYSFLLSHGQESSSMAPWSGKFKNNPGNADQWQELKNRLYQAAQNDPSLNEKIDEIVQAFNTSGKLMHHLLDLQYFKPVHWKESERKINFRRFFTINDLICLRMEKDEVFRAYHSFIQQLCEEGLVSGLRIDHIDGLFDPAGYLEKLSKMLGNDFYIIIEKILEWDEELPNTWPMQGTSGYHFLAIVNNLFTASQHQEQFKAGYKQVNPGVVDYKQLVYDKKSFILHERMGGELQNLWDLLEDLKLLPEGEGINKEQVRQALSAFLAAFPVYRIYPTEFPLTDRQRRIIDEAHLIAVEKEPLLKEELDYLRTVFTGEAGKNPENMGYFLQRCQQFTGPLAAKGVEDTSFYIYNQLISHNEVGDSPQVFGISIDQFHDLMKQRKEKFPLSINATATHDTKRGEDARMRINVLSGIPEEWFQKVEEWHHLNKNLRKRENIPDKNEEYFIYQALIGAMPFGKDMEENFLSRTSDYLQKVLREAKEHSFWSDPDEAYEKEVADFVKNILEHEQFRASFDPFRIKIAFYGAINSLGQSLIKVTAPGIPDIYQGSELWDLSYVDPDNRRPVDYDLRKKYLEEFEAFTEGMDAKQLENLMKNYPDGKIKMFTLYRALRERRLNKSIFEQGDYISLTVSGDFSQKVISYARYHQGEWYLIVVPLLVAKLSSTESFPLGKAWEGGYLDLPKEAPGEWINVYTDQIISSTGKLALSTLFESFPVVLLKSKGI
ncbi:MAG: malto-oligosyltrehalose synthase [Anditalea sp.]